VIQPEVWVAVAGTELSAWSSFTLAQTTDSARPQILEFELTRELEWKRLTVGPAVTMFFYHDPVSIDRTRSIEGWLHVTYDAGPFSLVAHQSIDVLTYHGAYLGEAGIESEHRLSERLEVGGSVGGGWASAAFNNAYADVARSAFDRLSAEGWLTVHVTPHGYIGPHAEFSTMLDRRVRAALARPTFVLVGLETGVTF